MTDGFEQLRRELTAADRRLARATARPLRRSPARLLPVLTVAIAVAVVAVILLVGTSGRSQPGLAGGHPPSSRPAARPAPGGSRRTLPCEEAIGDQSPPQGWRVVLGVVALPAAAGQRRALQTARTGGQGSRLFAKSGLVVRSDRRFELMVPAALRGRLSIGWGNAGEGNVGAIITDPDCRAARHRWIDFAGGFWTTRPICAPLIVAAGGRRRQIRVGIGKACPGQLPPPQPTQR